MRETQNNAAFSFWKAHLELQDCGCPLDLLFEQGHADILSGCSQAGLPLLIPGVMRYQAPPAAGTTCAVLLLAAFHAFLSRTRYSQQQLVLGVQPSHLLMPAASMALKPPRLQHLPVVPMAFPNASRGDTILSHARKMHNLLLDVAPHALTSLPDICTAAGITPAPGTTPQQALFRAAVVYARDAAAGRAAAAGLDVALLLLPGPKPGSRHVLQAVLLTSQGLFSQEGAGLMARHFETFLSEVIKEHYSSTSTSTTTSSCNKVPCLVPLLRALLFDAGDSWPEGEQAQDDGSSSSNSSAAWPCSSEYISMQEPASHSSSVQHSSSNSSVAAGKAHSAEAGATGDSSSSSSSISSRGPLIWSAASKLAGMLVPARGTGANRACSSSNCSSASSKSSNVKASGLRLQVAHAAERVWCSLKG